MTVDEGVLPVRNVREMISRRFDNDPQKLVEYYMEEQQQYRDHLLPPAVAPQGTAVDEDSRGR